MPTADDINKAEEQRNARKLSRAESSRMIARLLVVLAGGLLCLTLAWIAVNL